MNSRLDRLFILLDTGSNDSIRVAAAKQIGEVQRLHPDDLNYLLKRVREYTTKPVWETRVAAGHAIKYILENVDQWQPNKPDDENDKSNLDYHNIEQQKVIDAIDIQDIINNFDLADVCTICADLLSTELDSEIIDSPENPLTNPKPSSRARGRTPRRNTKKADADQLNRQRKLINKELGIGMVDSLNLGIKSTDIVSNEDLLNEGDTQGKPDNTSKDEARRQAKLKLQRIVSIYDKTLELLRKSGSIDSVRLQSTSTKDDSTCDIKDIQWPLTSLTNDYFDKLCDPSWEVRHGAAIALREIIRFQGKGAGKLSHLSTSSNIKLNQLWLIEFALKSMVVMALDKFGDFLFDQVVAPIRENIAQLISCCIAHLDSPSACGLMKLFASMCSSPQWERRHGAILGLKYSLNVVDKSITQEILHDCFDAIFKCLNDQMDDVSAEAAMTLVPVKDLLIQTVPDRVIELIKFLWDHLVNLDELTSSTSNIILLLSTLMTSSSTELTEDELVKSLPRLWPLINHSSSSVRIIVLKALTSLIRSCKSPCLSWMSEEMLTTAFRLIYQRAILENIPEVRPHLEDVWSNLLITTVEQEHTQRINLLKTSSQYLAYWLCLAQQPLSLAIDRSNPMWLNIGPDGTPSNRIPEGSVYIGSYNFNDEDGQQQKIEIVECRLQASKLLGHLYATLVNEQSPNQMDIQHVKEALKYLSDMFIHHLSSKSAYLRIYSSWTLESWSISQYNQLSSSLENTPSNKDNQVTDKQKIDINFLPNSLVKQMCIALRETNLCYDELASSFTNLQQTTREFLSISKRANLDISLIPISEKLDIYSLVQIESLCKKDLDAIECSKSIKRRHIESGSSKTQPKSKSIDQQLLQELYTKQISLQTLMYITTRSQRLLSASVLSSISCAMIGWHLVAELDNIDLLKIPLLESIGSEENPSLRDKSIKYLIKLLDRLFENCDANKEKIDSILSKLIEWSTEISMDNYKEYRNVVVTDKNENLSEQNIRKLGESIVFLDNLQKQADMRLPRRQSTVNSSGSSGCSKRCSSKDTETYDKQHLDNQDRKIRQTGSSLAMKSIVAHLGQNLDKTIVWQKLFGDTLIGEINMYNGMNENSDEAQSHEQNIIQLLDLLAIICESMDMNLLQNLYDHLYNHKMYNLKQLLGTRPPLLRHHVCLTIALFTKSMFGDLYQTIVEEEVVTRLNHKDPIVRCGAIETIALVIEHLQFKLVNHIDFLMIHLLRRMSDQHESVRLLATHCFGRLLTLMPLNSGSICQQKEDNLNNPSDLREDPENEVVKEKLSRKCLTPNKKSAIGCQGSFIDQLLNPSSLDTYEMPFEMTTKLRSYQQDGLNWLAFLNRFNLNGILCDEMGLGKTLMTICMLASDHYRKIQASFEDTKTSTEIDTKSIKTISSMNVSNDSPSLIICPTSLTDHWFHEIIKFLPENVQTLLNPIIYYGSTSDRNVLSSLIAKEPVESTVVIKTEKHEPVSTDVKKERVNVIIGSYDIIRKDIVYFKRIKWNYCVLDEGHIIKNVKSKISCAIRSLEADHRLILSGTPIQNNVTELWSLFDFLMPGFLGSERLFNARYSRPILQSRGLKCSPRDQEAGALAMESLHRQVLPFILRRLKENVLKDLPAKIIQDYYCELSDIQAELYEDFKRSKICQDVTKNSILNLDVNEPNSCQNLTISSPPKKSTHVFQALQYLKNVCNHPRLVLNEKHPKFEEICNKYGNIEDIAHSSKLNALKQLLIDCGIANIQPPEPSSSTSSTSQTFNDQIAALEESIVTQHRALIFCQSRSMVSIIEKDLLKAHLPNVTYLKLDGSVPQNMRYNIVSRFNEDPSIDLLLLTTQIGGLGLNLTGADTVIFVEHDWNPTKDLQAMDRAHRIGQKKVVNVYRLITKDTLEEKIMGLQKFKTMVSNTVINQDNSGLATMDVDQLLDLFDANNDVIHSSSRNKSSSSHDAMFEDMTTSGQTKETKTRKSFVELLPELWDQSQYDTEYDLNSFVSSLKGA